MWGQGKCSPQAPPCRISAGGNHSNQVVSNVLWAGAWENCISVDFRAQGWDDWGMGLATTAAILAGAGAYWHSNEKQAEARQAAGDLRGQEKRARMEAPANSGGAPQTTPSTANEEGPKCPTPLRRARFRRVAVAWSVARGRRLGEQRKKYIFLCNFSRLSLHKESQM